MEGVVKVQQEERDQLISTSNKKMAEARELSLALIAGQQGVPKLNSITKPGNLTVSQDSISEFAPGAPPPDTPENPVHPTTLSTVARPKLKDYLMARKEGSKEEKDVPGVRPPPVGSEAEPTVLTHAPTGINYPGMMPQSMPGSVPGVIYPPAFYQNPQFAAMYAQSLNMVKGLQVNLQFTLVTSTLTV